MLTPTISPETTEILKTTWKGLRENVLHEGTLSKDSGSILTIQSLSLQLKIDIQESSGEKSLKNLFDQVLLSKDPSVRIAGAGIARSFCILGTWGSLVTTDKIEKEFCLLARKVSQAFLRNLSRNFLVRWCDTIREKIASLLLRRAILPSEYQDSYRRKDAQKAREEEGFDAVLSFGDAGIRGELGPISEKIKKEKDLRFWESLLKNIERFLHDVLTPSLSSPENVARLQMQWRLLTREIDLLCSDLDPGEKGKEKLKNYGWQFNCTKKLLLKHFERGEFTNADESRPVFHIKRTLSGRSSCEFVDIIEKRLSDAGLLQPMDPFVVLEIRE